MSIRISVLAMLVITLALLSGCNRSLRVAEQKAEAQRTTDESARYHEARALRNAPLVAARNGLDVDQVRSVLLAVHRAATVENGLERGATWASLEEDVLTPLLLTIAVTERLPPPAVAQILFDDRLLKECP